MGASIEALAMAGVDYLEIGDDTDKKSSDGEFPPYLLVCNGAGVGDVHKVTEEEDEIKTKALLVSWAKAVGSVLKRVFADR